MYIDFGLLLNASMIGIMLSVLILTSPTVFKTLDEKHSSKFLRYFFPRLFNLCAAISALAMLIFYLNNFHFGSIANLSITVTFLINSYVITPKINAKRDLFPAGDTSAKESFKFLHFVSVGLYMLNLFLAVGLIIIYNLL